MLFVIHMVKIIFSKSKEAYSKLFLIIYLKVAAMVKLDNFFCCI